MMTEQEINEKWFPICQPGNLVKLTYSNGSSSFFIVIRDPKFRSGIDDRNYLELWGEFICRPNGVFRNHILEYHQEGPRIIIIRDDNTLEVSTYEDMLSYYDDIYKKEIQDMTNQIREIKSNICTYRKTLKILNNTMKQRYEDARSCFKKKET